jgi:hypothetical protein
MTALFKRLLQIIEYQGFKNLNDFALNGLNYDSSSKLNRLKKENTSPSVEILLDISNKFQNINLDWLITGKGEMLKSTGLNAVAKPKTQYIKVGPAIIVDAKDELIMMQKKEIIRLENALQDCEEEKKHTKVIE